jgi:hypothetical protein
MALEFVATPRPPADNPARGFPGEGLLANPAAAAVKAALAALAAESVRRIRRWGFELASASRIPAAVTDLRGSRLGIIQHGVNPIALAGDGKRIEKGGL